MAMTVVTFAFILGIVRMAVTQNFVIMASQLLVEYSWLVGVTSIDLACRVYITKVNLRDFMQVKNTLNLQILDLMQEEGCEFAFPTTTVDLPEKK